MSSVEIIFHSNSTADTHAFACQLGAVLRTGDCVLLRGPVGAGKSFLSRAIIQSLQDNPEDVPSPTFTLVQTYDTHAGEIWHCDLYRLSDTFEVVELGLLDAMSDAITLIEWPDRLGDLAPDTALSIEISDEGPDHRAIKLTGQDAVWAERLKKVGNNVR